MLLPSIHEALGLIPSKPSLEGRKYIFRYEDCTTVTFVQSSCFLAAWKYTLEY